jgi:hypothetical protein
VDWLDEFWGDLLSEEPLRIIAAWSTLDANEQAVIFEHLSHMAADEGWADVQKVAAQATLYAIQNEAND